LITELDRRKFLSHSIAALGTTWTAAHWPAVVLAAQHAHHAALFPENQKWEFFTPEEAKEVEALASCIIPSDGTPGAREAGVAVFIDRQLAGSYGRDRFRYTQPPFEDAPDEFGYQGSATPRQIYREGLKGLRGFHRLSPTAQDEALRKIESSLFFSLLRQNTIEGMFCDPIHGGNAGMVGWQLVGFPGPRMSNLEEIEKYYGQAFRPKPLSLRQATGVKDRPSEDEP